MNAISLWQPWATLWLLADPDEKRYETRPFRTSHRGPLLVHAAQKHDGDVRDALEDPHFRARLAAHGIHASQLAFGALIGKVELIYCGSTDLWRPDPKSLEYQAGNWESGRFCWERAANPELFRRPIPYKGHQGFFGVPNLEQLGTNQKARALGVALPLPGCEPEGEE